MMRDHAATASAAFAMAGRPELPEGQRAAALDRGLAIVAKYRLNPDDFDIPGRQHRRHASIALLETVPTQLREDRFWQGQRDAQWQARCRAQAMGRGRLHVVDPAS